MKFLVDMPLSPQLAAWLVQKGHDAVHAGQVGMARARDRDILRQAHEEQRIVVTADLDYPRLLALMHLASPGVILLRGGDFNEQECIERVKRLLESLPEFVLPNSIVVVEKHRIRRRPLPVEPHAWGSRKNKFTFWRERRAGRCKAPRRRRCGDIVEERQRSRCLPAAAPRRAAAFRPTSIPGSLIQVHFGQLSWISRPLIEGLEAGSKM